MASSNQPFPKSSKVVSICDKWRKRTDFDKPRFSGYAPVPMSSFPDIGRLTAGKATQLVYVILGASLGKFTNAQRGERFNEVAADITTAELAELCYCDVKTIQRELADLKRRGVILWEQSKKGVNVVTPLFRHWAGLADYKPAPVLEPEPEPEPEPEDEPLEEDEAPAKETVHVIESPIVVRAGKKSKRFPINCGVRHFECEVRGKVDAECSAVVKDGVLRVILEGKWDGKKLGKVALETKEIPEKPRHSRGISPDIRPAGKKRPNSAASLPRAAELIALFDPLILRWSGKTLSGDIATLRKACGGIGEVPHDTLVHDVEERAERALRLTHVEALCREIQHNWKAGKGVTRKPEKEKKKTFADRLKDRAIENLKKHGRIS